MGGQLLVDGHASRVLPGFDPTCKVKIIKSVWCVFVPSFLCCACFSRLFMKHTVPDVHSANPDDLEIIVCVNARDIAKGRVWFVLFFYLFFAG